MANLSMSQREYDRLNMQDERKWISTMRGFFDRQLKPLLQRNEELNIPESLIDELPKLIQVGDLLEIYKKLYTDQGQKYYERITKAVKSRLISIKNLNADDPYFRNIGDFVETEVARRIVTITETSRKAAEKAIRGVVDQSLMEGWGIDKTKRAIDKAVRLEWRNMKKFRPHAIARTEVASIANRASYLGAVETGLDIRKVWSAHIDDHTRESHVAADGQEVGINENFIVEGVIMQHPGEVGAPADQVINCRCRVLYKT